MYCPNCATQNMEGARFCRGCGADISLVPQALTGQLALSGGEEVVEDRHESRRRGRKKTPTIDEAIKELFVGVAFLIVFLCGALFFRGGFFMWFWAIFPALGCLGGGLGKYARLRQEERRQFSAGQYAPVAGAPTLFQPATTATYPAATLPGRETARFAATPPASITEDTTRHLNSNATSIPGAASSRPMGED